MLQVQRYQARPPTAMTHGAAQPTQSLLEQSGEFAPIRAPLRMVAPDMGEVFKGGGKVAASMQPDGGKLFGCVIS